jgi:hypothetical protein
MTYKTPAECLKEVTWNYSPELGHFLSSKGVELLIHSLRSQDLEAIKEMCEGKRVKITRSPTQEVNFVKGKNDVVDDLLTELNKLTEK